MWQLGRGMVGALLSVATLMTAILVGVAEAAILTWDGSCTARTGDNSWDAQCLPDEGIEYLTNWDSDTLPDLSSHVIIPAAFGQTLIDNPFSDRVSSVNSEASLHINAPGFGGGLMILSPTAESTIHGLNLEAGDMLLEGQLTLTGTSSMEKGAIYDDQGSGRLINAGDFTIKGVAPDPFANTALFLNHVTNRGTVTQRGHYSTDVDTFITNEGTWSILTNPSEEASFGGSANPFINRSGAVLGKAGAELVFMSLPLRNEEGGTVIITQGALCLFSVGNQHHGGTFQIDPGAEVILFEGYPEWGIPAATLEWTGGTIGGGATPVGSTPAAVASGTGNEQTLQADGEEDLGIVRVQKGATKRISGAKTKTLTLAKLEVQADGRVIHASEGVLKLDGDAVIRNEGIYDLAKGDITLGRTSNGAPLFENKGLLRKSAKESGEQIGDSTIEVPLKLEAKGQIELTDGKLILTGGGEFSRDPFSLTSSIVLHRKDTTPVPELIFAGSDALERVYQVKSGHVSIGDQGPMTEGNPGVLRLMQGAVLSVQESEDLAFHGPAFVLDGGRIAGPGTIRVFSRSAVEWVGGDIGRQPQGPSSAYVVLDAEMRIMGPSKTLAGTLIVGTPFGYGGGVTQQVDLTLAGGQVTVRLGVWTITENVTLDANSGGKFTIGPETEYQSGELRIDVSSEATFSAPLDNRSRVWIKRGALRLSGPIQQTSSNTLTAGKWQVGDPDKPDLSAILDMDKLKVEEMIKTIGKDAEVAIAGPSNFPQLLLETNDGTFKVRDGARCQTPGSLTNNGYVSIECKKEARLVVNGTLTNDSGWVSIRGEGLLEVDGALTNNASVGTSDFGRLRVKGNLTNNDSLSALGESQISVTGVLRNNKELSVRGKASIEVGMGFVTARDAKTHIEGSVVAASYVNDGGRFSGNGTVNGQRFDNKGKLVPGPGNSAGVLTFTGDYEQFAEGTLEIELGGAEVGIEYDQLVVEGNASLDGTLSICLIHGYLPDMGESFQILAANSVTGGFSRVDISGVSGRKDFQVIYGPQTVTLTTQNLSVASYEQWLAAKFSPDEQADPDISGANADPDSDGLENLLEYVFALRPGQADHNPVTPDLFTDEPDGDTFMTLTFPWADGMTDVDFSVETSTDLVTWSPATAEVIATVQESEVKILTLKLTPSVGDAEQMFARLLVNRIVP